MQHPEPTPKPATPTFKVVTSSGERIEPPVQFQRPKRKRLPKPAPAPHARSAQGIANDAMWRARMETNPYPKQIDCAVQLIQSPDNKSGWWGGFAGGGKTYHAMKAVREMGYTPHLVEGSATVLGLCTALAEAAQEGQIVIADDANELWTDPKKRAILKKATSTDPSVPRLYPHQTAKDTRWFDFRTLPKMIVLTNLDIAAMAKGHSDDAATLHALKTRFRVIRSFPTKREIWEYICYLVIVEGALRGEKVNLKATNDILAYCARRYAILSLNLREMQDWALIRRSNPDTWESTLDIINECEGKTLLDVAEADIPRLII